MTHAVIFAGEGEYTSHETMRAVEEDLTRDLGFEVTFCSPDVLDDIPHFPQSKLGGGFEALESADLLLVYTRWRQLPNEQMLLLARYIARGGPVIGFRTSTHAFRYREQSVWSSWNDGFGRDILGTPWVRHHGHTSTTRVTTYPGVHHPILEGVEESFQSPSWLYYPHLSGGCHLLLHGDPLTPEIPATPSPVAWTRQHFGGGKVFYTSLGHPDDFKLPSFRRMVTNAARWAVST
jgi:type 1 glutamine amidotransferase